jgi:tRNA G18 (ribose-2'-O)-methylase SpoU
MGAVVEIGDPADPRLGDFVGLTDVARRRRVEPATGLFVAEGEPVVRRALAAGYPLRSLLLDPKRLPLLADVVAATEAPTYAATPAVLAAVTGFNVHRGVLASFARTPPLSVDAVLGPAHRLIVAEGITSTTNLGAILRSAAALGIDGVVLSPDCCDPLYRRCVRVSMGESLRLPIARAVEWPATLTTIVEAGFAVLALTPDPDAAPIEEVLAGLDTEARVALVVGSEGEGLSAGARGAASARVRVPMADGVDSLNVAAAAAIACYLIGRAYPQPP